MTTALEYVRYSCGIAGEEVAEMVDELETKIAERDVEIERLKASLYGLYELEALEMAHGERIEKLTKMLLLAKDALERLSLYVAFNGDDWVKKEATEAIAAINDSKLVEGLILCDAEELAYFYIDDGGECFGHPDGYRPTDAIPLYAPRRTE